MIGRFLFLLCYLSLLRDWNSRVGPLQIVGSIHSNISTVTAGGFGRHLWEVDLENLPEVLKIFYIGAIFYAAIQGFTKVSICLFYLRIFPQRWLRIATIFTIVWTTASCLAFIVGLAFQCHPVASFWDRSLKGTCVNQLAIIYSGSGAVILQDLTLLILPIPCISSLEVKKGKKVSLFVMFSLGVFALVTSLVRLKFIIAFGSTTDVTCKLSRFSIG
jgi:hypothetical protein